MTGNRQSPVTNYQLPITNPVSISVSHLSYRYRARTDPALRDVSVEFRPGELTLIAGASGCGKTTLVRCINGLIPQSYAGGTLEGSVTLFGQSNAGLSLSKISQMAGTVLQDPERQIVASVVLYEIAFGLENLGLPRAEILDRAHEVARRLRIEHLLERQTFSLSGGEKQKVALAGVLAMRPHALLLDEPLASLDPASGHETLQMIRSLADDGIAAVVIEHRVEDVLAVRPEHCIYMAQGAIAYDGNAAGLTRAVDWREIKLPAPVVMERVRAEHGSRGTEEQGSRGDKVTRRQGDKESGREDHIPVTLSPPHRVTLSSPMVELRNVHFRYGDGPEVLHDVSLVIHTGDRIAVMGPNGAGKSTLTRHLIGLNKPTSGQVFVAGVDAATTTVAEMARTVGYVFQSPSHMLFAPTVREELSFGPRNIGLDAETIARRVAEALEMVGLAETIDSPPLALSFGQQKRISIASVLTMGPRVLVMDEPTAGQDYANYTRLMNDLLGKDEVGRQKDEGRAIKALVFVTHDLDLAITYGNRIVLVAEGRIVADGKPEDVLTDAALLERCRLRSTSLLQANIEALGRTGRFLPAPALASE